MHWNRIAVANQGRERGLAAVVDKMPGKFRETLRTTQRENSILQYGGPGRGGGVVVVVVGVAEASTE